jgi:crotonobetainyl-CoA:carnitine CoA-transferase CaiB-like acyl-CoA transferase
MPDAPPCKVQVPVVDMVTGYLATVAVLAALAQRRRAGAAPGAHRPPQRSAADLRPRRAHRAGPADWAVREVHFSRTVRRLMDGTAYLRRAALAGPA